MASDRQASSPPADIIAFFRAQAGDYLELAVHHQRHADRVQAEIDELASEAAVAARKRDLHLMAFKLFGVSFADAAAAVGLDEGRMSTPAGSERVDALMRLEERAKRFKGDAAWIAGLHAAAEGAL